METSESPDLEVAQVLASGFTLTSQSQASSHVRSSGARSQPAMATRTPGAAHASAKVSDKLDMRPATVMTNFTRGNTSAMTPIMRPLGVHHLAAQGEIVALRQELDGRGVDEKDSLGFTPLMWAVAYNQFDMVQDLIGQEHANCRLRGNQGESVVAIAAAAGNDDIMLYLLDACHCEVNAIDQSGNNALMYAAYGGHTKCVEELLSRGADLSQRNAQHLCAFDIAVQTNKPEVQRAIETHLMTLLNGALS